MPQTLHKTLSTLPLLALLLIGMVACKNELPERPTPTFQSPNEEPTGLDYKLPDIDLNNWKVTLPIPRSDGKPMEIEPPEILDYANNEILKPLMYNDSSDGSLVFYAYPGTTTTNTTYSRTELREQMVPGSNSTNWTFEEGGKITGTLAVPEISKESNGDFHRVIIMQIHGRLSNSQRDLIGASDNNAPPVLKIYWQDNQVYVRTKVLKDTTVSYERALETDAWEDDDGTYFNRIVGTDSFKLEVVASKGRMTVSLDDDETLVYEGVHMDRWGIFENYFKAGCYLGTRDENGFARVKYYNLEVSHD